MSITDVVVDIETWAPALVILLCRLRLLALTATSVLPGDSAYLSA
jgi:hypothetical protein